LEHVYAYRGGSPACAWVRSIVRNYALDISRKQSLMSEELADVEDPSLDPAAFFCQRFRACWTLPRVLAVIVAIVKPL